MDKLWRLTFNLGDKIPGKELLLILEKIDQTGSLNRAVEEAGLSYRYGWGLLNRAEESLGKALVTRQAGGSSGGGTTLTHEGKLLLGHMQSLQREVQSQLSAQLYQGERNTNTHLMLASTMEPVVTGLLDVLEQKYLHDTGVTVHHIAAGSGQAMTMAKAGRVDMILTHAPALEAAFVREGWGTKRTPIMSDTFILVGPSNDPAEITSDVSVSMALQKIAACGAQFISRGDQSGTHLFEMSLWQKIGLEPSACHWYHEARNTLGNYGIMRRAVELGAYTLVDRASYLTGKFDSELTILFCGDSEMKNVFSLIPISRKMAAVNQEETEKFTDWLLSATAQKIIGEFGKQQFGGSLFDAIHS